MNILIYDKFPIVRNAIMYIIENNFPNTKITIAKSIEDFFLLGFKQEFNILFGDFDLEIRDIDILLKKIKFLNPKLKIIFFSDKYSNLNSYDQVLFLNKNSSLKNILDFFETNLNLSINSEKSLKCSESNNKLIEQFSTLSNREIQCAILMLNGYSLIQISRILSLALTTISTYKTRILKKTDAKNLIELTMLFYKY